MGSSIVHDCGLLLKAEVGICFFDPFRFFSFPDQACEIRLIRLLTF